jgi:hypothetical protein
MAAGFRPPLSKAERETRRTDWAERQQSDELPPPGVRLPYPLLWHAGSLRASVSRRDRGAPLLKRLAQ